LTPSGIRDLMPLTCCITHGSIVARAEVLRAAGGYRQEMAPAEDYDLWLRLLPTASLAKLPQRLYQYRVHAEQFSTRTKDDQIRRTLAAKFAHLRRVCPDLPARARLTIVGSGRGDDYYRAVAPQYGFDTLSEPPTLRRDYRELLGESAAIRWAAAAMRSSDALVVTDFTELDAYQTTLIDRRARLAAAESRPDGGPERRVRDIVRIGNFFVSRRRSQEAA
jgi:hypothetical protein